MSLDEWKAQQAIIERLFDEIKKIKKAYRGNKPALEALQKVECWAYEESVPPVTQKPAH